MNGIKIKEIIERLINTFIEAGNVSIDLRKKGLNKEIKSDDTPVSNGDLEVNRIVTQKLLELTPDIPIVSEETSHNKSIKDLKISSSQFVPKYFRVKTFPSGLNLTNCAWPPLGPPTA